jgi:RNA polymerase sigma-70 factor, ECF subfamily
MSNELSSEPLDPRPESPGESFDALLKRARDGDERAASAVYSALYEELRELAHRFMRRQRPDHTLQATELVNQAYLHTRRAHSAWNDRVHAVASVCSAMRRILIDHERRRGTQRRKPPGTRLPLDDVAAAFAGRNLDPIEFHDQLEALAKKHERAALVVELHLLFGYSLDEIARILKVSKRTIERDWEQGREAWP